MSYVCLKRMCILLLNGIFCDRTSWLIDRTVIQVYFYTDFLSVLSIIERVVLISTPKIVDLSIFAYISVRFYFMYFEARLLGAQAFSTVTFS